MAGEIRDREDKKSGELRQQNSKQQNSNTQSSCSKPDWGRNKGPHKEEPRR